MGRFHSAGRAAGRPPPADALGTALWLHARGYWPVPITPPDDRSCPNPGKAPIGRGWGTRCLSTRALFAIYGRHPRAGVGIVLGPRSGVIDLEVDDPDRAGPVLAGFFPDGLPPTLGWTSRRGEHRLFLWDERLARSRPAVIHLGGGAVELRLGGGNRQVAAVCPPSLSTDGVPRLWNGVWELAACPEALVEIVLKRADHLARRPIGARCRFRPRARGPRSRYALAALAREAEIVRAAEPGTRNATLNRAAFRLGQLAALGWIAPEMIAAELTAAALDAGLSELEVDRTVRSGLTAGLSHPRGPGAG